MRLSRRLQIGLSSALALCVAIAPAAAHAQQQPQPQTRLSDPDPRPMRAIDPLDGPAPELGRKAMASFGACVADASTDKARSLLLSDFRTASYHNGMRALSENNRGCVHRRGTMRSPNLMFAGAVAERLLQAGDSPLNVRLAMAAAHPAPATFGPSDQLAQCVVRSAPDETSALFAAPVESQAETRALGALDFVVGRCAQGRPVQMNPGGLRAILATAAFRNVEAAK
jgi:hypothetical protein